MIPPVRHWPDSSLERIAYRSVESLPVKQSSDANRLGYYVYCFLKGEYPSLTDAVRISQAEILLRSEDAVNTIQQELERMLRKHDS